jgi:hypothetical protein
MAETLPVPRRAEGWRRRCTPDIAERSRRAWTCVVESFSISKKYSRAIRIGSTVLAPIMMAVPVVHSFLSDNQHDRDAIYSANRLDNAFIESVLDEPDIADIHYGPLIIPSGTTIRKTPAEADGVLTNNAHDIVPEGTTYRATVYGETTFSDELASWYFIPVGSDIVYVRANEATPLRAPNEDNSNTLILDDTIGEYVVQATVAGADNPQNKITGTIIVHQTDTLETIRGFVLDLDGVDIFASD